jgi:hypothetical protein
MGLMVLMGIDVSEKGMDLYGSDGSGRSNGIFHVHENSERGGYLILGA